MRGSGEGGEQNNLGIGEGALRGATRKAGSFLAAEKTGGGDMTGIDKIREVVGSVTAKRLLTTSHNTGTT